MSGIEVAGLVLGGLPLLISALEHLATMEKLGRTWWRFKREYQKDLNRLRDIQLVYRGNMRTLLAPLECDGTLDAQQIERLMHDPSSPGWSDPGVQNEICQRLGEFKDRYLEILQEMKTTALKLAKASKIEDIRFQSNLQSTKKVGSSAPGSNLDTMC